MNNQVLRQLSFAFLPIIVFIIADEFYGVIIGMAVAMVFSGAEFIYTMYKHKKVDFFILFDVLLISILGGISIVSHNDIFFKLKPVFIQSIILGIFGIAAFSNYPLMENMTKRYMKDLKFNEFQRKQMKRMSKQIFFIFLFHTLIIIYTAFYASRRVWAFASGGLFYIIMAAFMILQWWQSRKMLKSGLRVDVFDKKEKKIGELPEILLNSESGILHKSVHLYILNKRKELFLKIGEELYETPYISHVYINETVSDAIMRIVDLNLTDIKKPELLFKYISSDPNDSEFVYAFYIMCEEPQKSFKNKESGMFFTFADVRGRAKEGIFTPSLLCEVGIIERITDDIKGE